jgi:hypothetical protein
VGVENVLVILLVFSLLGVQTGNTYLVWISTFFWVIMRAEGGLKPTFRDYLSFASSTVELLGQLEPRKWGR